MIAMLSDKRSHWRLLGGLALLAACGSQDAGSEADAAPAAPDGGINGQCASPASANAWFRFSQNDQQTSFYGVHEDFEAPRLASERLRVGGCAFFAHQPTLCDPACTSGVCIESECLGFPGKRDAPAVTLEFNGAPRVVERSEFGAYTDNLAAAAAGDPVRLTSAGNSVVAAFDLEITAVAPVMGDFVGLVARDGEDLTIEWDAATSDNPGDEVVVHLDSDHHGTAAYIECVVPTPATAVTIDKSLIDAILLAGETGIGTYIENSTIERRNPAYSLTTTDCVSLVATFNRSLFVDSDHGN